MILLTVNTDHQQNHLKRLYGTCNSKVISALLVRSFLIGLKVSVIAPVIKQFDVQLILQFSENVCVNKILEAV